MKRILIITVFIISTMLFGFACAKSDKVVMPSLKFNGNLFTLYYSAKSDEIGSYINEYYKQRETYASWTELIALHHYPNAFYPIEHAKAFQQFLDSQGVFNSLEINEKENSATLDFVAIDSRKLPIIMEFNVFKYVKSPVCGTVGLQYARRYRISNALEVDKVKKTFTKTRKKYIKKVNKLAVPDMITVPVEYGKYVNPKTEEIVKESVKVEEHADNNKDESVDNKDTTESSSDKNQAVID